MVSTNTSITYSHLCFGAEYTFVSFPSYHARNFSLAVLVQNDIEGHARLDEGEFCELCAVVDGEHRRMYGWCEEEEEEREEMLWTHLVVGRWRIK